jgi:hypothetical protein
MEIQTCDLCQRPATFFYSYFTCNASGGQAEAPRKSVSLCAEHAALHARAESQRSLAQMLKAMKKLAQQAKPVQSIGLTIASPDKESAQNFQWGILQLCGGKSFVSSPETIAENLRRAAVKVHLDLAHISAAQMRWEVQWNSDTTISVLDQWQTEGWSQRLHRLIVAHSCEVKGWSVGHTEIRP